MEIHEKPPVGSEQTTEDPRLDSTATPELQPSKPGSVFANLNILERFLAVWIILAIAIGIILGNFVPSTGPALQKGNFVGVSVPVGKLISLP